MDYINLYKNILEDNLSLENNLKLSTVELALKIR